MNGLVQFIPSMSVAEAVAKHGDLLGYLRSKHPDYRNATTFDVQPQVLDTFVRSCGTLKEVWPRGLYSHCSWLLCYYVPIGCRR